MSKPEKDFFEDMMGKLAALPIIGVVYVVLRFWRVVPRALSFTGSWLLFSFLFCVPLYSYFFLVPIGGLYYDKDGLYFDEAPFLIQFFIQNSFSIPIFVTFCIAVWKTIHAFRQPATLKERIKSSATSWLLVVLILYAAMSFDYEYSSITVGYVGYLEDGFLDYDYQTPIFIAFWYAVAITIRNTIRVIRKPARLNKLFEAARGVFFGTVPYRRKEMPITRLINDDGHILVVGGAGSGKSSCIAIPTLKKYWDGRFLAVDIKGELAEKSGRNALIFNPTDPNAYGYDPFYLARTVDNPISYIRDIALTIVPTPPNVKDRFWIQAAQNILTGHLLYSYQDGASFFESIEIIQSVKPHSLLEVVATNPQALMYISQFLDIEPKTLAGIMSELSNHIIPYIADPDIKTALTAKNIITPELLEQGHDIFLQIPEHKITLWKSMIALIIQQFLTHFQCRPEGDGIPPILFLLDEFARLEKIEGILHGLATLRSKKICICIIIQSLAQLDATYGTEQRKIIADNCAYKAILKATDADTQKYFSALVGTQEVEQVSVNKKKTGFWEPADMSTTTSLADKAIIRPEQFAYLEKVLVLFMPDGFQIVRKVPYYTTS